MYKYIAKLVRIFILPHARAFLHRPLPLAEMDVLGVAR